MTCVCAEGEERKSEVNNFFFLSHRISMTWSLLTRIGCLARKSQGSTVSAFSGLRAVNINMCHHTRLFDNLYSHKTKESECLQILEQDHNLDLHLGEKKELRAKLWLGQHQIIRHRLCMCFTITSLQDTVYTILLFLHTNKDVAKATGGENKQTYKKPEEAMEHTSKVYNFLNKWRNPTITNKVICHHSNANALHSDSEEDLSSALISSPSEHLLTLPGYWAGKMN